MTPEISLILPAYNEARVIEVTIGEAVRYFDSRGLSYQIIVAADGTDGTREIVRELPATGFPRPRQVGAHRARLGGARSHARLCRGATHNGTRPQSSPAGHPRAVPGR